MTVDEAVRLLTTREARQANGAEGLTRLEAECVTMRTFSPSPSRLGGQQLVDALFLEALIVIAQERVRAS